MAWAWSEQERRLIAELARVGRLLFRRDLTWGVAGNLSARLDADHCLVTGTGTTLEELGEDDFARAEIGGDGWAGPIKPSSETRVHQQVYLNRPDAGAVLHASPPYTTLVASSDLIIDTNLTPESMFYVGAVAAVPYLHAGTAELAEAVGRAAAGANAVIMGNHGMLSVGPSVGRAFQVLESLEVHCKYEVLARAAGLRLNYLSPEQAAEYVAQSAYKGKQ